MVDAMIYVPSVFLGTHARSLLFLSLCSIFLFSGLSLGKLYWPKHTFHVFMGMTAACFIHVTYRVFDA
jgi:hypothetical protein